ncbi:MAG: nitronate monooxygenase [Thermoproteota archaeon]|nr:nitronate monooxygenase [Thermoproteota archaeon]
MIHTDLCDLLGIESPIIQAAIAPYTSAELVAAVSNAGGLGSVGTALRSNDNIVDEVQKVKELTGMRYPFAINFTINTFNEDVFRFAVEEAKPRVISCALGNPKDLVKKVHNAGLLFMQQVHTVKQALEAADLGVDIIIAQGSEAGGFCSEVSSLSLIPGVVDAVKDRKIPVVAAGGIANGRGLAAALMLGAQGVNIGTRFLASVEAALVDPQWKKRIITAESEDTTRVHFINQIFPILNPNSYRGTAPRALRTSFIEEWSQKPNDEVQNHAEQLRKTIIGGIKEGRNHELIPFTGQSTGLIHEILPAGEIVGNIVKEAEETIASTSSKFGHRQ